MEVLTGAERLDEPLVAGQVRHDAHLDLRVVGRHERVVALADDEELADATPLLGADRDVLEVRLGGAEPARGGDGLEVRGVDAAVVGHRLLQSLDRDAKARRVTVTQQRLEEGVLGLGEEVGQRVGVGGPAGLRLLRLRHAEGAEEHLLELLGRAEVDLLAADRVPGVLLGLRDLGREVALEGVEARHVDGDAGALHAGQDVDERDLHLGQELLPPVAATCSSSTAARSRTAVARTISFWAACSSASPPKSSMPWPSVGADPLSSRCRLRSTRSSRW